MSGSQVSQLRKEPEDFFFPGFWADECMAGVPGALRSAWDTFCPGALVCGEACLWAKMILGGSSWAWVSAGRRCFGRAIKKF